MKLFDDQYCAKKLFLNRRIWRLTQLLSSFSSSMSTDTCAAIYSLSDCGSLLAPFSQVSSLLLDDFPYFCVISVALAPIS